MKKVRVESGVIVGTSGDKFSSRNPIALYLLRQFDKRLVDLIGCINAECILEVGCGEGHVTRLLLEHTSARIHATDISHIVIAETQAKLTNERLKFSVKKLEEIVCARAPDLVVCCEVLEHLADPELGLRHLASLKARWYLMSVPREPIFRLMNMARGAYLADLGNSPGHLNHWSTRSFLRAASRHFEIVEIRTPLPWTILLCRPYK